MKNTTTTTTTSNTTINKNNNTTTGLVPAYEPKLYPFYNPLPDPTP